MQYWQPIRIYLIEVQLEYWVVTLSGGGSTCHFNIIKFKKAGCWTFVSLTHFYYLLDHWMADIGSIATTSAGNLSLGKQRTVQEWWPSIQWKQIQGKHIKQSLSHATAQKVSWSHLIFGGQDNIDIYCGIDSLFAIW